MSLASKFGLNRGELRILKRLSTPARIQDFLNSIPFNDELDGETCMSPRLVLKVRLAHCLEGAMLAAAALRVHGHRPLVLDMCATAEDDDHAITVYGRAGAWGAISKTGSPVLRYREPVYRTIHELVLSFFHEYFTKKGKKTLRSYSAPIDLGRFDHRNWMTAPDPLWDVGEAMSKAPHHPILTPAQIAHLRKADPLEIKAGRMLEPPCVPKKAVKSKR